MNELCEALKIWCEVMYQDSEPTTRQVRHV